MTIHFIKKTAAIFTVAASTLSPLFAQGDLTESASVESIAPAAVESDTNSSPSIKIDSCFSGSLLRVNVTAQPYNFYQPWEKGATSARRGLGVLIKGKQVLVTAQLVADSTYIELEMPGTGETATGQTEVIDYEANLALIILQDEESDFLDGLKEQELDTSAKAGDMLDIWQVKDSGLPVNTACPIVEVAVQNYFLEGSSFLSYQAQGSLRYHAGSFVIPVAYNNKLAGLLLSYNSDEQISRIIAAPIIERFLNDVADDDYVGFPTLGLAFARTVDKQLRKRLKLDPNDGGVYVTIVVPGSTAERSGVKIGDVLLELDGHAVDIRGNYDHPDYGKVSLSHIIRDHEVGEEVKMTLLREGEKQELTSILTRKLPGDYLIDPYMFDRGPKFYIAGGIVFQELSRPYLQIFGNDWRTRAPLRLLWALAHPNKYEEKGREKLVFISRVIRTPATLGYESVSHAVVDEVNGRAINSLDDVAKAFESPEQPLHQIKLSEAPHELYLDVRLTDAVNGQMKEAFRMDTLSRLD